MKKLLLGTAAVALGMTFVSGVANAQVKLDVGGYAKLYGTWVDQDETGDDVDTTAVDENVEVRSLDMARDTEIHFTGETTLDNGLTVGFHTEAEADGSDAAGGGDSFDVQESYAYFSGAWGRVNFGAEDGATYLLQVAAPSADANYDGLRQFINPIRHTALDDLGSFSLTAPTAADDITLADIFGGGAGSINAAALASTGVLFDGGAVGADSGDTLQGANSAAALGALGVALDYDHAASGYQNKLTYMTPVFNGFQAGVSYTPDLGSTVGASGLAGNNTDDVTNAYGAVFELAARYEGQWDQLGVALGGGWSHVDLEEDTPAGAGFADAIFVYDVNGSGTINAGDDKETLDDREAWNVGVDFDWMAFGLGGGYSENDNGVTGDALETETWVVGGDYTTGPFKIGVSYLDQDQAFGGAELERDRWTGGVVYTYGPGMTFRGSVSFTQFEENLGDVTATSDANGDADATSFLLGTQIDF